MTKLQTRKNIMYSALIATLTIVLMIPAGTLANAANSIDPTTTSNDKKPTSMPEKQAKLYPEPDMTQEQKDSVINKALSYQGVKEWSSNGWEYVNMGFFGKTTPELKWETAIVHLKLPHGKGSPLVQCGYGWGATIGINLETNEVEYAYYPKKSSHQCEGPTAMIDFDKTAENPMPEFIPTAEATNHVTPGFLIARQNDVTAGNIEGSWANLNTPSFNTQIYNDMNQFIAFLVNQKWNNIDPTWVKSAWAISTVAGCSGCGFGANESFLAYADTSTHGNNFLRKVPGFTWSGGTTEVAQTLCDGSGTKYKMQITYGENAWQQATDVNCGTPQSSDVNNNSVFFENWNTGSSSNWANDITGTVKASLAKEMDSNNTIKDWSTSQNREVSCTGVASTTSGISGSLANAGTATWSPSSTPQAC